MKTETDQFVPEIESNEVPAIPESQFFSDESQREISVHAPAPIKDDDDEMVLEALQGFKGALAHNATPDFTNL